MHGSPASAKELAGYASTASALPGEKVVLKVTSTDSSWTARTFRLGWYQGKGARLVATSASVPGVVQPAVQVDRLGTVTAKNWSPSLTLDTTGWLPGSYVVLLTSDTGKQKYIPLTIRSSHFAGTVMFVSATTTYQAYNAFGGYSLYTGPHGFDSRARVVSFDRPYDANGARHATGYERQMIAVAERLGIDLSYATSLDLEAGPAAFAGVRGIISPGHDEYWSPAMRSTVEHLRDSGTNLAFLGANASYWRVRSADGGRTLIGYKSFAEDPVKGAQGTDLWRKGDPESSLTGMLYECFPATVRWC